MANKTILDAHCHYFNYMQQSEGLESLDRAMSKNGIGYSVLTGCSFKKTWVGDMKSADPRSKKAPVHHLYDDGDLYYYSATDGNLWRHLVALKNRNGAREEWFVTSAPLAHPRICLGRHTRPGLSPPFLPPSPSPTPVPPGALLPFPPLNPPGGSHLASPASQCCTYPAPLLSARTVGCCAGVESVAKYSMLACGMNLGDYSCGERPHAAAMTDATSPRAHATQLFLGPRDSPCDQPTATASPPSRERVGSSSVVIARSRDCPSAPGTPLPHPTASSGW